MGAETEETAETVSREGEEPVVGSGGTGRLIAKVQEAIESIPKIFGGELDVRVRDLNNGEDTGYENRPKSAVEVGIRWRF